MADLVGYTWSQKVSITGNKPASSQSWFPMLIAFDASTELNDYTQNSGLDIAFTIDGDDTPLPYEREEWTDNGANVDARFWVRVPSVDSASDTDLRIYIGKAGGTAYATPSDTWNENGAGNFEAVYHMSETAGWVAGGAGYVKDSTSNGYHGTAHGNADGTTGRIGGGGTFDGAGDYVEEATGPDPNEPLTISAWANTDSIALAHSIAYVGESRNEQGILTAAGDEFFALSQVGRNVQAQWDGVTTGDWFHVAGAFATATSRKLYVNGILRDTDTAAATVGGGSPGVRIGFRYTAVQYWDGLIDEVRISSVARAVEWTLFEYKNVADYANTITHGAWDSTASPSTSPSASSSVSVSSSPSASPSASLSASPTASVSASPSASLSASPTASVSTSPSASPSASVSASLSASPTASPSASVSASLSASPTTSPSASPSASPSTSVSASPSASLSASPTASPSASLLTLELTHPKPFALELKHPNALSVEQTHPKPFSVEIVEN